MLLAVMTGISGYPPRFQNTRAIKQPHFIESICLACGEEEFDTFLGINITSDVNSSNKDYTWEMLKTNWYLLYRARMNINRFRNIFRFLWFDNRNTRIDKAAAIFDLWPMLSHNLLKKYKKINCWRTVISVSRKNKNHPIYSVYIG